MGIARWIVLEDDPEVRSVVAAMCQIWDIEPIQLVSGEVAMLWIEDFKRGHDVEPLPQLALLDLRMPGIQGEEVARALRAVPKLQRMAIVLMTAFHIAPEEEERIMEYTQADLFLRKPLPRLFECSRLFQEAIETRKAKVKLSTDELMRL